MRNEVSTPTQTSKVAWTIKEWCVLTSIGRTVTFGLIKNGDVESVKVGHRRLITTPPAEYITRLLARQC